MIDINIPDITRYGVELLMAAVLGGIIGFEREMHGQGAGFRTNILICIGACLMMQLSLNMEVLYEHLGQSSAVRVDPGRIASYAIAGMGFLGAGAIIKGQSTVRGLTTASGLWLVTGVGLAVGCGFYVPALITVIIAMLALYGLRTFKPLFLREIFTRILLKVDEKVFDFEEVERIIARKRYTKIEFVNYRKDLINQTTYYNLRVTSKGEQEWREITDELLKVPGIGELSWEERTVK